MHTRGALALRSPSSWNSCSRWLLLPLRANLLEPPRRRVPAPVPALAPDARQIVCKHPFPSIPVMYELAHLALPSEQLPRRCRVCACSVLSQALVGDTSTVHRYGRGATS
eukprot:583188-Pleurochrysis_carterae.AAC.1